MPTSQTMLSLLLKKRLFSFFVEEQEGQDKKGRSLPKLRQGGVTNARSGMYD